MAYGHTIWPYKDMSAWVKVDAADVLPPVYEKKVGRPPKSRRKQPFEIQGPSGPKLRKNGSSSPAGTLDNLVTTVLDVN